MEFSFQSSRTQNMGGFKAELGLLVHLQDLVFIVMSTLQSPCPSASAPWKLWAKSSFIQGHDEHSFSFTFTLRTLQCFQSDDRNPWASFWCAKRIRLLTPFHEKCNRLIDLDVQITHLGYSSLFTHQLLKTVKEPRSLSQRSSIDLKPFFCQEFSKNSYSFRSLLLINFSVRLFILPCKMQDNHNYIFSKEYIKIRHHYCPQVQ